MFTREQPPIGRLLRLSLLLAAVMAFWASFDARLASASCGDYVMVGGGPGHDQSSPGVPTCHGPSCRSRAPLPMLPTKGLLNVPPADAAIWSHYDSLLRPALSGRVCERSLLLAEGHSLPLLRPPCL
ncbi:MAG TPA: hypothetical protein VHC22_18390 [Pirellulales bacterium]|nr:hypothetical protein [Pirellulales bacterium]